MRDILIVFCILLVLLIVISTLGGSIRPTTPAPEPVNKVPEEWMNSRIQRFTNDMPMPMRVAPSASNVKEETNELFTEKSNTVVGFDGSDAFASF